MTQMQYANGYLQNSTPLRLEKKLFRLPSYSRQHNQGSTSHVAGGRICFLHALEGAFPPAAFIQNNVTPHPEIKGNIDEERE